MKRFLIFFSGIILLATSIAAQQFKSNPLLNKTVKKPETKKYSAYLFVYFTGNIKGGEQIRFALSNDGYNYKALNNNEPIISSAKISLTGGVRDPHIYRGADGNTFYMVATD